MSCGNLHARHWFTMYGFPHVRTPYCARGCGTENPRPLSEDELRSYESLCRQQDEILRNEGRYFGA